MQTTKEKVDMHEIMQGLDKRFDCWYANVRLGDILMDDVRNRKIFLKEINDISDEDFETLTVDMAISDAAMAEIFSTSNYSVKKRRKTLGIPRGNANINRWFYSDRWDVDIKTLIKNISA